MTRSRRPVTVKYIARNGRTIESTGWVNFREAIRRADELTAAGLTVVDVYSA